MSKWGQSKVKMHTSALWKMFGGLNDFSVFLLKKT